MIPDWRRNNLGGGGLQALNIELARGLRSRRTAWLLLLLFPAGLHRWYLREPVPALAYPCLSLAAGFGWSGNAPAVLITAAALLLLLLAHDAATLENRIAAFNKRLRMAAWLRPRPGNPADTGAAVPARTPGGYRDGNRDGNPS